MPTKRTRINRNSRARITAGMAMLLSRIDRLGPTHMRHLRSRCPGKKFGHCEKCAEFYEKHRELDSALGLRPWETSPADVDFGEPPGYIAGNEERLADYRQAQKVRRQIEALL